MIIATSSRPHRIDPAILRPVYVYLLGENRLAFLIRLSGD